MKKFVTIIVALCIGAAVTNLIKHGVLKKVDLVQLVAETSKETRVSINIGYRSRENGSFNPTGSLRKLIFPGSVSSLTFRNHEHLGDTLQLQIQSPTKLTIHSLGLHNARADTWEELQGETLSKFLKSADDRSTVSIEKNQVVMTVDKPLATATLYIDLKKKNTVLRYGLSILFAIVTLVLIQRINFREIPAIKDLRHGPNNGQYYLSQLDGVRGLAALLVVLEHTWAPFAGSGATGVWMFFILSGYLLAQPFVANPARAADLQFVAGYMARRVGRIVPMYFVVVFISFGFNNNTPLLIEHLLFVEASGHLWTIPQELAFYLFLPAMMLLAYCVCRVAPWLYVPALSALCLLLLLKPELAVIQLRGNGLVRPPFLGWFLLGVVLAGLNPTITLIRNQITARQGQAIGLVGIVFLVILIAGSCYGITSQLLMQNVALPVNFPRLFAVGCMILILLLLIYPQSLLGRFFNLTMLRSIGIIGYSFYLLHPMVIKLITDFSKKFWGIELTGFILFLLTSVLTWAISLFTYSQIERPFLSRARRSQSAPAVYERQSA